MALILYRYSGKVPVMVRGAEYTYSWQQDDIRWIAREDELSVSSIKGMTKIA